MCGNFGVLPILLGTGGLSSMSYCLHLSIQLMQYPFAQENKSLFHG
jgi:hypothetical protein